MEVLRKLSVSKLHRFLKPAQSRCQRFKKLLKVWLFHSSFTFIVLLYIAIGAAVLVFTERSPETAKRRQKLDRVLQLREAILDKASKLCHEERPATLSDIESELKPLLQELSFTHEYDDRFSIDRQKWSGDASALKPLWTFYASVLYAVTALTATGYDRLSPQTDAGRIFAIAFGMLGIPLMFVTAANIGTFLSNVVTVSCAHLARFPRLRIASKIWPHNLSIHPPKVAVAALDRLRRRIRGLWFDNMDDGQGSSDQHQIQISGLGNGQLDSDYGNQVPAIFVFAIIGAYCSIGSWLFNTFENGPVWSFLFGFCFSFNTITTVTVGDISVDHGLYLALVVAYCIVGLAVITMCVDLVSVRMKNLFTKMHYYGRRLALLKARARSRAQLEKQLAQVVEEATEIEAVIRQYRNPIAILPIVVEHTKMSSTIREVQEPQKAIDEASRPTFMPGNIGAIPWADSEEDIFTAVDTSTAVESMESYAADYI